MIWTSARKGTHENADYPGKQSLEVGQDLGNVMYAAAENCEKGVAKAALQRRA
jgi:hypothetical protein